MQHVMAQGYSVCDTTRFCILSQ